MDDCREEMKKYTSFCHFVYWKVPFPKNSRAPVNKIETGSQESRKTRRTLTRVRYISRRTLQVFRRLPR